MSLEHMAWAAQQTAGGCVEKAVLMAMADSAGGSGEDEDDLCETHMTVLAMRTEASMDEVEDAIEVLKKRGLIREAGQGWELMRDGE